MKKIFTLIICTTVFLSSFSQSLEDILDESEKTDTSELVEATFKSIRLINSHTVKNPAKGNLYFLISHRFGEFSGGFSNMFGLDNAAIRLGLEYGLFNKLAIGFGRSGYKANYDMYAKYKLLSQSKGKRSIPISLSIIGVTNISSAKWPDDERDYLFSHRMSYSAQLIVARKFTDRISLQLMPTYIHRNLTETNESENDVYAAGIAGRFKFTNRLALTCEYHYTLPGHTADNFVDPLSIGFDIETGGHVFQLFITNAGAIYDAGFIPETTSRWSDGDLRFGFNISRLF